MIDTLGKVMQQARDLIVRAAIEKEVIQKIEEISKLNIKDQKDALVKLYVSAEREAELGNTKYISLVQLVSEHFHADAHTRMLLHYYAQSEANRGKRIIEDDISKEKVKELSDSLNNISEILKALSNIAKAFTDADNINKFSGEE